VVYVGHEAHDVLAEAHLVEIVVRGSGDARRRPTYEQERSMCHPWNYLTRGLTLASICEGYNKV
jgi:hypothetical protein